MSLPLRLIVLAAAVAALAGCNRDRGEAPVKAGPPPVASVPAEAGAPFFYNSKTQYAEVSLKLPQALKPQPDLHARLYAAAVRDLRQFSEGAQADRTEAGGDEGMPPYDKEIAFLTPVETGKLFSLMRRDYESTGGAHPNTLYAGVMWDKALKRPVALTDLLAKGADMAALDRALCAAVNAEKKARVPDAAAVTLSGADWKCPRAAETPFVLTAGGTPGKAGGLTFVIAPYVVGPYAEGAYQVVLPAATLAPFLAPAYAAEFGGTAVKPVSNPAEAT